MVRRAPVLLWPCRRVGLPRSCTAPFGGLPGPRRVRQCVWAGRCPRLRPLCRSRKHGGATFGARREARLAAHRFIPSARHLPVGRSVCSRRHVTWGWLAAMVASSALFVAATGAADALVERCGRASSLEIWGVALLVAPLAGIVWDAYRGVGVAWEKRYREDIAPFLCITFPAYAFVAAHMVGWACIYDTSIPYVAVLASVAAVLSGVMFGVYWDVSDLRGKWLLRKPFRLISAMAIVALAYHVLQVADGRDLLDVEATRSFLVTMTMVAMAAAAAIFGAEYGKNRGQIRKRYWALPVILVVAGALAPILHHVGTIGGVGGRRRYLSVPSPDLVGRSGRGGDHAGSTSRSGVSKKIPPVVVSGDHGVCCTSRAIPWHFKRLGVSCQHGSVCGSVGLGNGNACAERISLIRTRNLEYADLRGDCTFRLDSVCRHGSCDAGGGRGRPHEVRTGRRADSSRSDCPATPAPGSSPHGRRRLQRRGGAAASTADPVI